MIKIPSLRNVNNSHHIIYNSKNGDKCIVIKTRPGRHDMIFTENKDRLYYSNMSNNKGVYMLSNMEKYQKHYKQRQYERANIAGELYPMVGYP